MNLIGKLHGISIWFVIYNPNLIILTLFIQNIGYIFALNVKKYNAICIFLFCLFLRCHHKDMEENEYQMNVMGVQSANVTN